MSYELKPYGWHFRLQQWTFGDMPRLNNFCPFFWITIFCIMVSPFVGAFKSARWLGRLSLVPLGYLFYPIVYLAERYNLFFDAQYGTSRATAPEDMTPQQAHWLFDFIYSWSTEPKYRHERYKFSLLKENKKRQFLARFNAWKDVTDNWEDIIKDEQKKIMEAKAAFEEAKRQRKKKYMQIAQYTKTLVLLPIGIGAIYLLYFIGLTVILILENPEQFLAILITFGVIAVGCAIVALTVKSLDNRGVAWKALNGVASPVARGTSEVWSFFKMNFDAFMKNYCPTIEWKD